MAKGRGHGGAGHKGKKDTRRSRNDRKSSAGSAPLRAAMRQAATAPVASPATRPGVEATRGPVSGAFRAWASEFGRRQAQALAGEIDPTQGVPADMFVLAPLTTRTVRTPRDEVISVQMGLPIVATRAGGVGVAPDRLAVAVLRYPEPDTGGAMAMLGLGQAPDLPPPEALFVAQLPAEGMRGVRPADAVAWYLARVVEGGEVSADPGTLGEAAGEALALLRPNVAPRSIAPLHPTALESYTGYGVDADEEAVPLDITAAPARGGVAGLPTGAYLHDDGTVLEPLLADLRDYVIGTWPYDYFELERLTADPAAANGPARGATLAGLADLVRRLDGVLAESAEAEEAQLASEGRPPAWIAQETARYREARQALRASSVAQQLLPRLGPILFDLEIPPADYVPADMDMDMDMDEFDGDDDDMHAIDAEVEEER